MFDTVVSLTGTNPEKKNQMWNQRFIYVYDIISVERDSVFLKKRKRKKGELENGIGFP